MQRPVKPFRQFASLTFCAAVFCAPGLAFDLVTATAGSTSCSSSTSCSVTAPGNIPSGPISASAFVTDTWNSGGTLEASTLAKGPSTNATASVSYSSMLIVTGASGSGDITIQFTGFEDIVSASPAGGTVSPLVVTVGGNSRSVTIPLGGTFSATLPATFGVFLPFNVSFSDNAFGTMFMNESFGTGGADAIVEFPTFVVTDANGGALPGANVGFVPEPATFGLMACAIPALWLARRRTRRVQA